MGKFRPLNLGNFIPLLTKAAWENMLTIMDTCRKQGLSYFEYIKDILSGKREMTKLSALIATKATMDSIQY